MVQRAEQSSQRIDLGGEWDFRLEPLLDNHFGDYQWPGTDEKISACIYDAEYERLNYGSHGCINMPYDAAKFVYDNVELNTPVIMYW